MARRPYVPSGKSDPRALPLLAGATLAAALGAGIVEGIVSRWFSLLLIFPLALGLAVGAVGLTLVTSRRVRSPVAAGVIGLAMGLLSQGVVFGVRYQQARDRIAETIAQDAKAADFVREHGIDAVVDAALAGESGGLPFLGYLRLAAEQGVTITRAGHSGGKSSDPTLTGAGAYGLWLCNFLIAGGVAAWMMASQAREPFCEACDAWYDTSVVVANGAGDDARVRAIVNRIEGGDLPGAAGDLGDSDGKSASLLALRGCSRCQDHEPLLELRRVTGMDKKGKQEVKTVYASLITRAEAREIWPHA